MARRASAWAALATTSTIVTLCACGTPGPAPGAVASTALPLEWTDAAEIGPPTPVGQGLFGRSLQVVGDDLVIGAAGRAYVFVRGGDTWTEQQELPAPVVDEDLYGASVAISGDWAIVGAPGDVWFYGGAPVHSGAAYTFHRTAGAWTLEQKLVAGTSSFELAFGAKVGISGDYAIIGAPDSATGFGGPECGNAYVFVRNGSEWTVQAELWGANTSFEGSFGSSVGISGDTAVVAEPGEGAHVFVRDIDVWNLQQVLGSSTSELSIAGDEVAVGAAAGVEMYVRTADVWSLQQTLTADDAGPADQFGASISISGDTMLVGAPWLDGGTSDAGAAYVFGRDGAGWTQQQKLVLAAPGPWDYFGNAVSVSGGVAAVGAPEYDGYGSSAGVVHVYLGFESLGAACTADTACASGHCVDGVCCDAECGAGADDCQACSLEAGSTADGTCQVLARGTTCRGSTHACDAAEVCDGTTVDCPSDGPEEDGTPCDDHDDCTEGDACAAGACESGARVCGASGGGGSDGGAGAPAAPSNDASDEGGCSCRAAAGVGTPTLVWLVAAVGVLATRRRRSR